MLVGVNGEKVTATTMTLITEKLQEQSLSDRPCATFDVNLPTGKLHQRVGLYSYEVHEEKLWGLTGQDCALQSNSVIRTPTGPLTCALNGAADMGLDLSWQQNQPGLRTTTCLSDPIGGWEASGPLTLLGRIGTLNLNEKSGLPLAPPSKRHCRSLSEPDELSCCRSTWKPGSGSKIWTHVSKQGCGSGGVVSLPCNSSLSNSSLHQPVSPSCGRGQLPATNSCRFGSALSTMLRPSSASSGFVDSSGRSTGPSSASSSSSSLAMPCQFIGSNDCAPCRWLSVSQEHIPGSASSTPTSTPELGRRLGLLRCRSQPCVLQDRKGGLKRRREDEVCWSRPSLDFLKMTQTLKNTRSLCFLDDEDHHVRTIVPSPCDSSDLLGSGVTPVSSPPRETVPSWHGFDQAEVLGDSDGDVSDCENADDALFPVDSRDLDLEQIENN
ncbi:protein FAM53A [Arapaima gigas]